MPPSLSFTAMSEIDQLAESLSTAGVPLRIFGYGSIIWQPNFRYESRTVGCVAGYKRRFYQGSCRHRGSDELPGRVATLVPKEGATVWGVAFEIVGAEAIRAALAHLTQREVQLGGYGFQLVSFQPLQLESQPGPRGTAPPPPAVQEAFAYIAAADNPQYLGKASLEGQALQVALAAGPSGSNIDYVRGVAAFMRDEVPNGEVLDRHLFRLLRMADRISLTNELPISEDKRQKLLAMAPIPVS